MMTSLAHCIAPSLAAAAAFLGLAEMHDRRALGGAIAGLALGAGPNINAV